jgi:hypothetical protein
MTEGDEIVNLITKLFALIGRDPRAKANQPLIRTWAGQLQLQGYDVRLVRSMCMCASQDERLEPYQITYARLIAYLRADTKAAGLSAWDQTVHLIESLGSREAAAVLKRDHPDWSAACRVIGGVESIGMTQNDQLTYKRHAFLEVFEAITRRPAIMGLSPQDATTTLREIRRRFPDPRAEGDATDVID